MKTIDRITNGRRPHRFIGMVLASSVLVSTIPSIVAGPQVPHRAKASGALVSSVELPPGDGFILRIHNIALGEGVATHEGRFTEVNEYILGVLLTESGPVTVIEGTVTVTAANGDKLVWSFSTVTEGIPVAPLDLTGSTTLVSGTGRFEGASGSLDLAVTLFADGSYEYEANGWITSVGSNRRP